MTTKRPGPSPKRHIGPRTPDVAILGETPLAELRIYESAVLLTRRDGKSWRQYPIEPDQLAQLLGKLPSASGILPAHTLGNGIKNGAPFYVVYVPSHRARLQMPQGRTYTIPLPPLIWCGHRRNYRVWALGTSAYPDRDLPLFKAPFPNCYVDGRICWGNVGQIPEATPKTISQVRRLFLEESEFNLHVADGKSVAFPVSVVARWQQLETSGAESYPLDDLMPSECSLFWALSGSWVGTR
jgi:PRTRC genetic system protein B